MSAHRLAIPSVLRLLLLSALGVTGTTAQAQSSLSLYGVIDLALGSFQQSALEANNQRVTRVESSPMTTSFIGFKGTEDLGGGVKAGFTVESFLRPDTGASGRTDADVFWGRAANVWLGTSLGKMTLGRQGNLLFGHVASFNPFGGAFGVSPAVRLTYGAWGNDKGDSGWSNAMTYDFPVWGGLAVSAQIQTGEATDNKEGGSYGLGLRYTAGPFAIGAAWQSLRSAEKPKPDFNADERQTFGLVSASFDAGFAKFFGQYGQFENRNFLAAARIDTLFYQVGASAPVTKDGKLLISYGQTKEKPVEGGTTPETKHGIFTIGYDHWLSKRTDLYAVIMMDDEKLPNYKKGYSYLVGVRHAF